MLFVACNEPCSQFLYVSPIFAPKLTEPIFWFKCPTNVVGGLSGPAVKPVALRCVWQVCNAGKIPVIGIGGITCAQDVLEFILVGAHAVEIGTMNFVRPDAAFRIAEELPHLCQQLGIKNLAEFRGTLQL